MRTNMSCQRRLASRKIIKYSWIPRINRGMTSGGYTLLELLLVIAILSVLATFGLNMYQQQTTDVKVTKTALQMQQLLEAATAFYVDNGCWPDTSKSTLCPNLSTFPAGSCTNPTPPPFDAYIPVGNAKNIWANAFHCQPSDTGKKFQVFSGAMPTTFISRIIARLPNADISKQDPQQIQTETAIPAQQIMPQPNAVIKMIEYTATMHDGDTYQLPTFTCPHNWNWNIDVFTSHIYPEDYAAGGIWYGSSYIISLLTAQPNCNSVAPDTYQCSLKALAQSKTGFASHSVKALGSVRFTYIAYCTRNSMGRKF